MSNDSPLRPSPNRVVPSAPRDQQPLAGPDLVLETNLFWDKYKLPVAAGIALLVLALVGSELYQGSRRNAAAAAAAKLDFAKTAAEYKELIAAYPDSAAAASAYLLLGREQMDAKDYDGAAQTWETFVKKFPQNDLAPSALLGQGGALEHHARTVGRRSKNIKNEKFYIDASPGLALPSLNKGAGGTG